MAKEARACALYTRGYHSGLTGAPDASRSTTEQRVTALGQAVCQLIEAIRNVAFAKNNRRLTWAIGEKSPEFGVFGNMQGSATDRGHLRSDFLPGRPLPNPQSEKSAHTFTQAMRTCFRPHAFFQRHIIKQQGR